jgi:hypothetical protein
MHAPWSLSIQHKPTGEKSGYTLPGASSLQPICSNALFKIVKMNKEICLFSQNKRAKNGKGGDLEESVLVGACKGRV